MRYLVLLGLIIGSLLGYYVLWSHLADQVEMQANSWIDGQRRLGRTVTYEGLRVWGFPYRLSLTFSKTSWADTPNPLGWRVEAEAITAHMQLWNMHHAIFDLPGRQTIAWRENGSDRQLTLTSARFRASLVADGAGNWLRMAADISKPQLGGANIGDIEGAWSADKLLLHSRRAGNVPPSIDLAVQADKLMLPPVFDGLLGREVQGLRLAGNARGTVFGRTLEEILSSWRDSGGVIDFSTLALSWGEMHIEGTGTLALDRQFRPLGAMGGRVRNAEAAIDALVVAGRMSQNEGAAAKAAIAVIEKEDDNKGRLYLPIAFTAQDGQLFLGPAPLFSLTSVLPKP